jgi:hypothetical protein
MINWTALSPAVLLFFYKKTWGPYAIDNRAVPQRRFSILPSLSPFPFPSFSSLEFLPDRDLRRSHAAHNFLHEGKQEKKKEKWTQKKIIFV